MTHCFKTSQLCRFPLGMASRCGTPEWNFIHRNSQARPSPAVTALALLARPFASLSLNVPALATAGARLPAPAPPHHVVRYIDRLTRQLAAMEAARALQSTTDWRLLRAAALSDCERRAFSQAALSASGPEPPGPPGADRPAERAAPPDRQRPSPDQLRAVEANLLENLPRIFVMTQDFSVYHKDLVFDNRIRGTKSVGIVSYIKQCALLRIVGHIKFSYVTLDVLQSSAHPEDDTIRIRWRIRGISALRSMLMFWKINVFRLRKTIDEQGVDWYDGYSIFQVGSDGKIHTHIADKMMPDWSREQLDAKPALGSLAALVFGLLPGAGASAAAAELGQLISLTVQLERLERQIDTALPLSAAQFKAAGST